MGGYSLGGADMLRRAMGKKKAEEMAEHRAIFREGAAKNNISAEKADEVFDLMERFAGYGFNKSHAAAYSCWRTTPVGSRCITPLSFSAPT